MSADNPVERSTDRSWLCWVALRAAQFWDFIDRRQLDCWAVTIFTGVVTYRVTEWAVHFASSSPRPGADIAMIIGAVMLPWGGVQSACIKFVFDARQTSFQVKS